MQLTGNYELKKPDQNDAYNIQNENDNMDIIDQNLKRIDEKVDNLKLDAANVSFTSSNPAFTSKKVNAALDYLFQLANNGKQYWVDVVGAPLSILDTFATLKDKTQSIKNTIATNITDKGVPASGNDSLINLANAINNISAKKSLSGTATIHKYSLNEKYVAMDIILPFTPSIMYIEGQYRYWAHAYDPVVAALYQPFKFVYILNKDGSPISTDQAGRIGLGNPYTNGEFKLFEMQPPNSSLDYYVTGITSATWYAAN